MQDITDNKKFWKTIPPYFSDKEYNQTKRTIVEKDSIITDENKNLDLKPSTVPNTSGLDEITKYFDDHISVCKIKKAYSEILGEDYFSFKMVFMDKVKKEVLKLNSKKCSTYDAIPASIRKQAVEVHLKYLTNIINNSLKESTFPDKLNLKLYQYIKNLTFYRRRIIDQ